jgi:hypothetical protein
MTTKPARSRWRTTRSAAILALKASASWLRLRPSKNRRAKATDSARSRGSAAVSLYSSCGMASSTEKPCARGRGAIGVVKVGRNKRTKAFNKTSVILFPSRVADKHPSDALNAPSNNAPPSCDTPCLEARHVLIAELIQTHGLGESCRACFSVAENSESMGYVHFIG